MRTGFLWKIYSAFALLILIITSAIYGLVITRVQDSFQQDVVVGLREKIILLEPFGKMVLEGGRYPDIQARLVGLAKESNTRVSIFRTSGEVLAESHVDKLFSGDNHWKTPEVLRAVEISGGAQRNKDGDFSEIMPTSRDGMLYIAKVLRDASGEPMGALRVGVPQARVEQRAEEVRMLVGVSALGAVFLALFVGYFLAQRVTVPIRKIIDVADMMRMGNYAARVGPLTRDEIGRLGETLNRLGDEITRRVATVSQERAQLQAVLAGMSEGILAIGADQRILFCNRAVNQIFGCSAMDGVGVGMAEFPGLRVIAPYLAQAQSDRRPIHREIKLGEGEKATTIEMKVSQFRGENAAGVIAVFHDVTDLRRLERVRQDFVANVSHELKTPLTSIKGYVETLLAGEVDTQEMQTRFLQKIERNVQRLTNLVLDILSLARVEAHEGVFQAVPVEWGSVVRTVVAHHEDELIKKNLHMNLEDDGEPIVVQGDREAIVQVIENLVNNAIKYTPVGGRITVRLRKQNSNNARLEVEDTGIGIPRDHLDRIFERFYRVDKARSREMGGTGLGLSIVKHLVSGMSGKVGVESTVGQGSRFWVQLALVT